MTNNSIGQRIDWLIDILDRGSTAEEAQDLNLPAFKSAVRLSNDEIMFLNSIRDRVNTYKSRTYISTSQINYLNRIDQKLRDAGF